MMDEKLLRFKVVGDGTYFGTTVDVVDEAGEKVGSLGVVRRMKYTLEPGLSPVIELTAFDPEVEIATQGTFTVKQTLPASEALSRESPNPEDWPGD